ncbi:MAG: carbon-nitrogen hydrolase family protein [Proteobacteria bacterium]|nr:carbon-nitrogen hydrolase family protein [Pseudomonadota bacterium]
MKKVALVQMTSIADLDANLESALSFIDRAVSADVDLIAFPENFLFLGNKDQYLEIAEPIPGPLFEIFQKQAVEKDISILMGSMYEKNENNPDKIFNTSLLIDRHGRIAAKYRKIHLFDVALPEVVLFESELVEAGNETVCCDHDIGKIGLSICYDIRFPNLYQKLTEAGAQVVLAPSAFTVPTGKAHWITLLRARAIENQVYVAAPAQYGRHSESRESFGNTVLIDPWGNIEVLAEDKETIIFGEIDLERLEKVRQEMPIQNHKVSGID